MRDKRTSSSQPCESAWEEQQLRLSAHLRNTCIVKDFASLQDTVVDRRTAPFVLGSYSWRLLIQVRHDQVGLYVESAEGSLLRSDSGPAASFTLTIINRKHPDKSMRADLTHHQFTINSSGWGKLSYTTLAHLQEHRSHFFPDGHLHIQVSIRDTFSPVSHAPPPLATAGSHNLKDLSCMEPHHAQQRTEHEEGTISVGKGMVCIHVSCPDTAPTVETFISEANQCMARMLSRRPAHFTASLAFSTSSIEASVTMGEHMLEQFPLLEDLVGSRSEVTKSNVKGVVKNDQSDKEGHEQVAPFAPPCSVWGLVSLLLLLEQGMTAATLFGDVSSPPSLPGQALQMARFLCCTDLEESITAWLRGLTETICSHSLAATADPRSHEGHSRAPPVAGPFPSFPSTEASPEKILHRCDVLQGVPQHCVDSLCSELLPGAVGEKAVEWALQLPPCLIRGWLRRCCELDLQTASLSCSSLVQLVGNLAHVPGLQVLHLKLPEGESNEGNPSRALERPGSHSSGRYRKLATHSSSKRSHAGSGSGYGGLTSPEGSDQDLSDHATHNQNVQTQESGRSCASQQVQRVLAALECTAVAGLQSLRVLGLHNIEVAMSHCTRLSALFSNLAQTLTGLMIVFRTEKHLSFGCSGAMCMALPSAAEKRVFFKAVSRLEKLKVLALPQWQRFVGADTEAVKPLGGLRHLRSVLVEEVGTGGAFVPDLCFKRVHVRSLEGVSEVSAVEDKQ